MSLARTPEPPYWAVIFTSERTDGDHGYAQMAQQMETLAQRQPGYLGMEHARDEQTGVTVSYWRSEEDVRRWKADLDHQQAQKLGREQWYRRYQVRVCRVERAYGFER